MRFGINTLLGESGVGRFVQSLTLGTGLLMVGALIILFGVQADISGKHRQLTQEVLYRLKKMELKSEGTRDDTDLTDLGQRDG